MKSTVTVAAVVAALLSDAAALAQSASATWVQVFSSAASSRTAWAEGT